MTQYLPPYLLALFAPRDPIPYMQPVDKLPHEKKRQPYNGLADYLDQFEDPEETPPPTKVETKQEKLERKRREKAEQNAYKIEQDLAMWNAKENSNSTSDPYRTLFVARINYDTSESKLRREFEAYGKIRQIKLVHDIKTGKPRGYAFVEYEDENSMHAAYKRADGKKIDGRRVVVDIERGRTIKGWKPRRLGGGKAGRKSHYDPMAVEKPSDVDCVEKFEDKKPRDRDRERDREKTRDRHKRSKSRSRSRERKKRSKSKDRYRSRSRERAKKSRRSKSKDRKTSKKRSKSRDKRDREGNGKVDRVFLSNDNAEPNGLNNYNNGNGFSNNGTEYGEIL